MSFRTHARRTAAATAGIAVALFATVAEAQYTANVTYKGGPYTATYVDAGGTSRTYGVGAIGEKFNTSTAPGIVGGTTLGGYCVDVANTITVPTTYNANVTSLAAVLGGSTTLAKARHTTAADLVNYQKAAFLIDQFAQFDTEASALRSKHYGAIQGALWALFTPVAAGLDASTSTTDNTVIEYWQKQANDFAASSRFATYNYGRFYIVTDVNAAGKATGGVQEFMVVTPEPASLALLALGLGATVVAGARRRRLA